MLIIVLEAIVQDIINHRESEKQMALDIQNIFNKPRVLNVRTLMTFLSIVFFLYFGIVLVYFYYLSPPSSNAKTAPFKF